MLVIQSNSFVFTMLLGRVILASIFSISVSGNFSRYGDYAGEEFPANYLQLDEWTATLDDLVFYLRALSKTVGYFHSELNATDVNKSLGNFFMRSVLGRTLLESKSKIPQEYKDIIVGLMRKADDVVSHYVYDIMHGPDKMFMKDEEYRVAMFFRESNMLIHSLGNFKRNRFKKWIFNKGKINEYIQAMDAATLPKEKYVELVDDSYMIYYILIQDSDKCLSRILYNEQPPPQDKTMRPCRPDSFCYKRLHASPSISYGLSHRLLNLMLYRYLRHCYWDSPEDDQRHMDVLCSFMYREAVYLARRGFFARDIFMEHTLCGFVGYEEMFRKRWFNKAIGWMNEEGCVQEARNFGFNRTHRFYREFPNDRKKLRYNLREWLHEECHNHPMSLLVTFLAHAVRYTAHRLPIPS